MSDKNKVIGFTVIEAIGFHAAGGPGGSGFCNVRPVHQCAECGMVCSLESRPYHVCDPDDWYAELAVRMKDMAPA